MTQVVLALAAPGGFGRYEVWLLGTGGQPTDGINVARDAVIPRLVVYGALDATGKATVALEPTSPPAAVNAAILPTGAVYEAHLKPTGGVTEKIVFQVPVSVTAVEAVDHLTDPPETVASSALSVHLADGVAHSGSPAAHPNLATHDLLGLATDAELAAHALTPHGGVHPDLTAHDTLGLATQAELDAHAGTPHGGSSPDATTTVKGLVQLAGDLSGTAAAPTVPGLTGKQAADADLTTIAALDSTTAGALATDGAGWIRKSYAQLKTALGLVKADVGLGNVDNTADTAKPVSVAQQAALDLKETPAGAQAKADAAQAFAVQRANHTGTQAQSTIVGLVADLLAKQAQDSDLDAIALLSTTAYGRNLLTLANLAAFQAVLGTGTPSGSTFLRGDGTWAAPGTGDVLKSQVRRSVIFTTTTGLVRESGWAGYHWFGPDFPSAVFVEAQDLWTEYDPTGLTGSQALETDTGRAGALASAAIAGARATETDTGAAGGFANVTIPGARATETDTGQAGALATTAMTGARATETDTGVAGALVSSSTASNFLQPDGSSYLQPDGSDYLLIG